MVVAIPDFHLSTKAARSALPEEVPMKDAVFNVGRAALLVGALAKGNVPFLRHDKNAIPRNPQTVNRIAGNLYQMGYDTIIEKCTMPKETNRQMGSLFKNWISKNIVAGEAKFLTDFGGHQNAQFDDALSSIHSFRGKRNVDNKVMPVAILDGVLYIAGKNKMHEYLKTHKSDNIFSALVLREFLYSL